MNIQAEKIALVKMLLDTEDQTLLQDIKALFKNRKDFYRELPQPVKDGIETSRKQAAEGNLIPLNDVIARLNNR